MPRSPHVRSTLIGAGVGAMLATALHLWILYATHIARWPFESIEIFSVLGWFLLGAPAGLPLQFGLEALPAHLLYPGMLVSIVVNWSLLFWLGGWFRRSRARA